MNFRLLTLALVSKLALARIGQQEQGSITQQDDLSVAPAPVSSSQLMDRNLAAASSSRSTSAKNVGKFKITVHNIAFQQPMSRFFAAVHSSLAAPLYEFGQPATEPLALLAENGDPEPLVKYYKGMGRSAGMLAAGVATDGALVVGAPRSFVVTTSHGSPYVSFASMAINTNDCFVGAAGILLEDGLELYLPGLDAGSEENNELCNSIPGPACADIDTENVRSGNGEGFVHVHRGFFGIGPDLSQVGYDWRNPMLKVKVERIF